MLLTGELKGFTYPVLSGAEGCYLLRLQVDTKVELEGTVEAVSVTATALVQAQDRRRGVKTSN